MRTHLTKRTRTALLAGIVLVVAGVGGAAYLGTRSPPVDTSIGKVPAYFAVAALPAGTPAATALGQGALRPRAVPPAAPGQRDRRRVPADRSCGGDRHPRRDPGHQRHVPRPPDPHRHRRDPRRQAALALELQPVAGLAGFAGAGDRIDIYGVSSPDGTPPSVRLLLQGVEVLNVNGTALPAARASRGAQT